MKKITLAVLTALSSANMVYSQTNIVVEAPPHTIQNFIDVLPGGSSTDATLTALYLMAPSELSALTATALTGIGIQLDQGVTGTAVNGTFTVYLQNTADITYSAGASFTAATATMSVVYNGNFLVPSSTNPSTVNVNFPQTFTYTGGGLYIGFKWQSNGPFVTPNANSSNLAAYNSNNNTSNIMGAFEEVSPGNVPTDVMNPVTGRPCILFKAINTATNEIGVVEIVAPGLVAKSNAAPQTVQAYVKNSSIGTRSNISVSLTVSGSNTFNNVQTISSLAPGATTTIAFASFNPTVMGVNHMTVTTSADQNTANNNLSWTQSVTCNMMGNNPPDPNTSFTLGIGFQNGGIFSTPIMTGANGATLTAVRVSISNDATGNAGKHLCGVLMDDQGTILGASDSLVTVNNSFQNFTFRPSQVLTANTQYFVGLAQLETGQFPMGCELANLSAPIYYSSPLSGGQLNNNSNFGYFGIEPILGPDVTITSSSNSIVCLGETISLQTNGGATSYTWSAVPNTTANAITTPSANSISVVPTRTESVTFTLKGADAFGCVNTQTIAAKIAACTGIYANTIKDAKINLYPNPSNGKTNVGGLEGTNTITVYNMLGEAVLSKSTSEETAALDLSSQPQGNYLVRIIDTNNHAKTIKFINQH